MVSKSQKKVFLGSDHAGYSLKKILLEELGKAFPDFSFEDCGCESETSVDYPHFAKKVCDKVLAEDAYGILICGSGIGMAMAANKVKGIRAAQVWDLTSARLSREHNDANVLCLGGWMTGRRVAIEASMTWLQSEFVGGRHQRRVDLIGKMEEDYATP